MTDTPSLSRRSLLVNAAAFGVSLNFLGSVAFAAADSALARRKLVVLVCRGAMDGMSVVPAIGDANFASVRGSIVAPAFGGKDGALKLDSTFGLHPALAETHKLALVGQARFAPAVATTDRSRSHFQGQDCLESGVPLTYSTSGWLNRALQAMAPGRQVGAMALGTQLPLILRGKIEASTWAPGNVDNKSARLRQVLSDLYAKDPLLGPALAAGVESDAIVREAGIADVEVARRHARDNQADMTMDERANYRAPTDGHQKAAAKNLGRALAKLMVAEHGPSIAAMSILGFDTHVRQKERLAERLAYVDGLVDGLTTGFGAKWKDTVVVAITEFGRAVRINGGGGTDHGTASAVLLAGGALKAGGIVGDWPTLQQQKLYENRDLAPTMDMRSVLKGMLGEHFAIDRKALDTVVFPDSAAAKPAVNLVG